MWTRRLGWFAIDGAFPYCRGSVTDLLAQIYTTMRCDNDAQEPRRVFYALVSRER